MTGPRTNFRPSARNHADMKKGAQAEASRAQVPQNESQFAMLQSIKTERHTQGIGDTVTVFNDKEMAAKRREMERAAEWLAQQMLRAEEEIFSEVVTITPALAKTILHRNPDNRKIKPLKLATYKADLEAGRWVLNGEAVVISKGGLLNDGQHRLTAVADTGVAMKALVVFGVSRASRLTLDQGADRKLADILQMGGHTEEAEAVGTVARYLAQWEKTGTVAMRRGRAIKSSGVTRTEGHGYALDHEREIRRSIKLVKVRGFSLVGTVGILAFAHLVMARVNREAAGCFRGDCWRSSPPRCSQARP